MGKPSESLRADRPRAGICLRGVIALTAGAAFSCGFPPADMPLVGFAALLVLFVGVACATSARGAFGFAFLFGLAWFVPGLAWTLESMVRHGHVPQVLAWAGLLGLGAVCAFFVAAAAAAARRLVGWAASDAASRAGVLYAFAGFFAAGEYLRGCGLADFAWLTPANLFVALPWAGWAPIAGAYGLNAAVFFSAAAALAAFSALYARRMQSAAGHFLVFCAFLSVGAFGLGHDWSQPGERLKVGMIQADLPVVNAFVKANPAARVSAAAELVERLQAGSDKADLVLTAEGILLTDLQRLGASTRNELGRLLTSAQAPVLFNGFRRLSRQDWRNTSFYFDPAGEPQLLFVDKRKLVPFGEYVPAGFEWFVDMLGIPLGELHPGEMQQEAPRIRSTTLGILICYENLDGEVLRALWGAGRNKEATGPELLVVTSNLGWFGKAVRSQHLRMTQLRALEASRPAASVSMNGLSAMVDEKGRITAVAPEEGAALLSAEVTVRSGCPTPYVRFGDIPAIILSLLGAGAAVVLFRGRRNRVRL